MLGINANSILLIYTRVFTKTLGLTYKYKIQECLKNTNYPLWYRDLYLY